MSSYQIPLSWVKAKLGDVINIRNGYAFKSKDYLTEGALLIRQSNIASKKVSKDKAVYLPKSYLSEHPDFVVNKGDVLIGMSGSIGKICIYDFNEPALQNQRTGLLMPAESINGKYVHYYYLSIESQLHQKSKGVGVQNISSKDIENLEFNIPPSNEQTIIALKLDELFTKLDAGIKELKEARKQINRYRQSVLKHAFTGKLTEKWRKANKGLDSNSEIIEIRGNLGLNGDGYELHGDKYPTIPSSWKWTSIGDIGIVSGGITKNSRRTQLPKQVPYLRVANVYAGYLNLSEMKEIGVKENEYTKTLLETGDLLVVEGNGSREQIGRAAIWDGSIAPCIHQNHIIRVRFNPLRLGEYVLVWMLSRLARDFILEVASSTSGLYTLSISKVKNIPVPFPPQAEQEVIISEVERHFSLADKAEEAVDTSLKQAERLRQSILKKAFEGRLVPQDPNDEPASVLLEHIKEEKEKLKATKKKVPPKRRKAKK